MEGSLLCSKPIDLNVNQKHHHRDTQNNVWVAKYLDISMHLFKPYLIPK